MRFSFFARRLASGTAAVVLSTAACVVPIRGLADDYLPKLVHLLAEEKDSTVQLDILRGIGAALGERRKAAMPDGWEAVETALAASQVAEVRTLAQSLGLTFGSRLALASIRETAANPQADADLRRKTIDSLVKAHDPGLPKLLQSLLKDEAVRGTSLRGLASYDDTGTPEAILGIYGALNGAERRDALNTLASRAAYARPLLGAVASGSVAKADLTADLVRQLRNLKDPGIQEQLTQVWGIIKETSPDMQAEIEKYKRTYWAGGSQPGDAPRGRAVFNRVCAQCHHLFDFGGAVGPDITGANRADLDYLLQNILYPNAVIPNEYRAATLEARDGRVITGIIKSQSATAYSVQTVTELVSVQKSEIAKVEQSDVSMMPEGLVATLPDQEFRDLLYYLSRPGQVPLPAGK